jgi:hypothetical protein
MDDMADLARVAMALEYQIVVIREVVDADLTVVASFVRGVVYGKPDEPEAKP